MAILYLQNTVSSAAKETAKQQESLRRVSTHEAFLGPEFGGERGRGVVALLASRGRPGARRRVRVDAAGARRAGAPRPRHVRVEVRACKIRHREIRSAVASTRDAKFVVLWVQLLVVRWMREPAWKAKSYDAMLDDSATQHEKGQLKVKLTRPVSAEETDNEENSSWSKQIALEKT